MLLNKLIGLNIWVWNAKHIKYGFKLVFLPSTFPSKGYTLGFLLINTCFLKVVPQIDSTFGLKAASVFRYSRKHTFERVHRPVCVYLNYCLWRDSDAFTKFHFHHLKSGRSKTHQLRKDNKESGGKIPKHPLHIITTTTTKPHCYLPKRGEREVDISSYPNYNLAMTTEHSLFRLRKGSIKKAYL